MNSYTTIRGPDILSNVFVSAYGAFYQTNQFFANLLIFHFWQNGFAARIWPAGHSLETLNYSRLWFYCNKLLVTSTHALHKMQAIMQRQLADESNKFRRQADV